MHILLAKDDTTVFDSFTRQLNEMRIAGAHYALHLRRTLQLLASAFAERSQVSNGYRVDPASLQLFSDCNR